MLGLGSLRCRLGWHRPRAGGRWNHGYCFTVCERCGRDMVRSAFGEWHIPHGFRVVAHGDAAAVAAFDSALAARQGGVAANAGDFAWAAAPVTQAAPPAPVAPPPAVRAPAPPRRAARPAAAGSPFDFGDFDTVDPGAGLDSAPPPSRPDPAHPPLSRAAP